jgi:leucyl-tRNA synthetase
LLAPTAPHLTEELWAHTGQTYSIHNQSWPSWDEPLAKEEEVTLVIQINGKLRDKISVPASITESEAKELAFNREKIKAYLDNREPVKTIYVPGKLVNIVIR